MPRSVLDEPRFRTEPAAYAYVEAIVWPNGRVCPHCGVVDKSGPLKGKSTRIGTYKCYACRKPFTVKVGTIFEKSHVSMHIWLQAMHIMCSSKKGFSANQFCRTLGVDFKTGWFIGHRIRLAMDESGSGPLGGEGKTVEVDETFQGYREGGPTWILHPEFGWQRKMGYGDRIPIVTLVERGGKARSRKVENVTAATLRSVVFGGVDTKSHLMTDELRAYRRIGQRFAGHDAVDHGREEWARKLADRTKAHTNTVEGFFSILKRGIYGCYFHVSERHLHRYLAEFDFRYSNRIALGVDDVERTERAIRGIIGKRLTYRTTGREAPDTGTA
jgi:transposase-like protein